MPSSPRTLLCVANYLQLFREHVFARTAGLEMLRGVFAGAAFGGVWMVLVSLGAVWLKAALGMVFWLGSYGAYGGDPLLPFQARIFPVLLIGAQVTGESMRRNHHSRTVDFLNIRLYKALLRESC